MFYDNGNRSLKMKDLNLLHDSSIAVWFGDSGKCNGKNVVLNTNIWGKTGTESVVEYLSSLDWKSSVFLERGNYRIKIDEDSSEEFLNMVASYLPKNRKCGRP